MLKKTLVLVRPLSKDPFAVVEGHTRLECEVRGRVLTHVDICWLHRGIERSYEAFLWSEELGYQLTTGTFSP